MNALHEKTITTDRLMELGNRLNKMKNYDGEALLRDWEYLTTQLEYFYDQLAPTQTGDPSTTLYIPKKIPQVHQVAYFNLTRGFPKELYGGHWCYIHKSFKNKFVIIPTTSVKWDSNPPDPDTQMDIEIENFRNGTLTRLQFSDMKTVDIQRLYVAKGFCDVETERKQIIKAVKRTLIDID